MRAFVFRHRRRKTEAHLAVVVKRDDKLVRIRGKCIEISRSGMLAIVDAVPSADVEVVLELIVPATGNIVRLPAVANPRRDDQCAFRFLPTNEEEQHMIDSELRLL